MPQEKKRTKRQHYVPRFYLSHFVDSDDLIWAYDAQSGDVHVNSVDNTAVESNFYSVQDESGGYRDEIEDWLADVEGKAAPLYAQLLKGQVPEGQDRGDLAVFFSSLFARSPALITAMAELKGAVAQRTIDFVAEDPERFNRSLDRYSKEVGVEIGANEREELRKFIEDKDRYTMSVARQAGLMAMKTTDVLTPIFFDMKWLVIDCPHQHLITSDNPVVRLTPEEDYHPVYGDGAFLNKKTYVTVPLSPSKILQMSWIGPTMKGLHLSDKQQGRLYNRQRAIFAERFLFSSRRDAGIESLSRKYRRPGVRLDLGAMGELAPIEVRRKI